MKISIEGNSMSFLLTGQVLRLRINLEGDMSFTALSPVSFNYKGQKAIFKNRQELFHFTEEIKGKTSSYIVTALSSTYNLPIVISGQTELELIKALFLIYNWIELPITEPIELELEKHIYNDFAIDYMGTIGIQQDIYFIDKKYLHPSYSPYLNRLIDLNLLACANFKTSVGDFNTYFTPLIKPGVSKEHFKNAADVNGQKTYSLWLTIMKERDLRIRYWMKNRI